MAYTSAYAVVIGAATKKTDVDGISVNADYLQTLANVDHDFHVSTGTGKHKTIQFPTGIAITAAVYSIGRDADATNQLHFNVPTGAAIEHSVNDVAIMTMDATGLGIGAAPITGIGLAPFLHIEGAAPGINFIDTTADADDWAIFTQNDLFAVYSLTNSRYDLAITGTGMALIGDTTNAKMTQGLTINQGAADDEILALKSSDVAHPFTSLAETDTSGVLCKAQALAGGICMNGYKDPDQNPGLAVLVNGYLGEAADTTKSTSGIGVIRLDAHVTDGGTGAAAVAATGNLLDISNHGTTRYIFDADGSAYADVAWTTYDAEDDLALVSEIEQALLSTETAGQTERRHALEQTGVIGKGSWHFEGGKPRAMVNMSKLSMLHHGALIQAAARFREYEGRIGQLESKLKMLAT